MVPTAWGVIVINVAVPGSSSDALFEYMQHVAPRRSA